MDQKTLVRAKVRIVDLAQRHVQLFDRAKTWYRRLGFTNPVHSFLRSFSRSLDHRPFFVQLGSNDGLVGDPIREFVIDWGWRGILIEPVPYCFERLQQNYEYIARSRPEDLTFINAAISDRAGQVDFWIVDQKKLAQLPFHQRQIAPRIGSLDPKHLSRQAEVEEMTQKISVDALDWETLLERQGIKQVDLVHMDVEGHEKVLLKTIDFRRWGVQAILFENLHLGEEKETLYRHLQDLSYEVIDGFADSIAVDRDLGLGSGEG